MTQERIIVRVDCHFILVLAEMLDKVNRSRVVSKFGITNFFRKRREVISESRELTMFNP